MRDITNGTDFPAGDRTNQGASLVPVSPGTGTLAETKTILPAIITDAGEDAVTRFAEYFTANIRNPHTRRAYFRNAIAFLRWCEGHGVRELKAIKPMLVAGYVKQLQKTHSSPSVKQQLATIRMTVRLAGHRPGDLRQPRPFGSRSPACRDPGQDAGAQRRRDSDATRQHPHRACDRHRGRR
jgi:hypothetical protein